MSTPLPIELQRELDDFIQDRIKILESETGELGWSSWSPESKQRFIDVSTNRFLKNHIAFGETPLMRKGL